jgi:hypothetical protein
MSIVKQAAERADLNKASRQLARRVLAALKSTGLSVRELAKIIAVKPSRLRGLLKTDAPEFSREEVEVLSLLTSTPLDDLFPVPILATDEIIRRDIAELRRELASEGSMLSDAFFCGGGKPDMDEVDLLRSVLQLQFLRMCLQRYPKSSQLI